MAYPTGYNNKSAQGLADVTAKVQPYFRRATVLSAISYKKDVPLGVKSINFPYINDLTANSVSSISTDFTIQAVNSTDDIMLIDKVKESSYSIEKLQQAQVTAKDEVELAKSTASALANAVDRDGLHQIISDASNTSTYTITGSTSKDKGSNFVDDVIFASTSTLAEKNTPSTEMFVVVSPTNMRWLKAGYVDGGFMLADEVLKGGISYNENNGLAGRTVDGLRVFISNNLDTNYSLTVAANPTANDYFTVAGRKITFKASGNIASDEITIGADAAATQTNIVAFFASGSLNATTAQAFTNYNITIGSFGSNVAVISGSGKFGGAVSFTSTSNKLEFKSDVVLFGHMGQFQLGMQVEVTAEVRQEPKRPTDNILNYIQYGRRTPALAKERFVKVTVTQA